MSLAVLAAAEHDEVEGELRERSAANAAEFGADTLLGRFELLTHYAGVAVVLAFSPHGVFVFAWSHSRGLHHALPREREAGMRAIVAKLEELFVRELSSGFYSRFSKILRVRRCARVKCDVHFDFMLPLSSTCGCGVRGKVLTRARSTFIQ